MQKLNTANSFSKLLCFTKKHPEAICGVLCALAFLLVLWDVSAVSTFTIGFSILVIIAIWLCMQGELNSSNLIALLFLAGFVLRLQYILYTGCTQRQHDVETFGNGCGHAGYIEYFFSELKLPDFDVREVWQFYHPPLHHIISAIFLKICKLLGIAYSTALEGLQVLTLYYSSLCMIISYKIFRELKIKGNALVIAFVIIAFHPTFIIFAGSINNDILSITFQLAAVLYTIRWMKNKTVTNIVCIALAIGLGMMTKLSAWMVAPAVAIVFLYALIKGLKSGQHKWSFFIKQYSVFALVCVPLGLWWSIRNYVLHSVPPNYIPFLNYDNPQYIGNISVFKRLFDFGLHQFESVFDMWGKPYYEYNPTIGLLKTAMFGESINDVAYPQISIFGTALFWIGTLLAVVGFMCIMYYLFSCKHKKSISDVLLLMVYGVNLVMYYYFCISFAFTCTQNIRYATPLILIGAVYIGKTIKCSPEKGKFTKCYTLLINAAVVLFATFTTITYTLIGI